jgi:Protein of unknown function (DUF1647)
MQELTVVTATSSNHYRSLLQFLRSVPSGIRTIVYDIGLTKEEVNSVPATVRTFDFSKYPEFTHLTSPDAGAYVWKPIVIHEVCNEFGGIVLWCDSGNIVYDVNVLIRLAKHCGVYTSTTAGTFQQWTFPSALQKLPSSERFWSRPMRNAACVCIDWSNERSPYFVHDWKILALRKEISLPEGANRSNHRHDQSILTYLVYSYGFPIVDEKLGYSIHNDID